MNIVGNKHRTHGSGGHDDGTTQMILKDASGRTRTVVGMTSCSNGSVSPSNHWGFKNDAGEAVFTTCPINYCCSEMGTPCDSCTTCEGNRTGVLCGECKQGFSLNLLSSKCVDNALCGSESQITYIIVHVLLVVFYFVCLMLLSQICGCCIGACVSSTVTEHQVQDSVMVKYGRRLGALPDGKQYSRTRSTIWGLLKVAFYFYQVLPLLKIDTPVYDSATSFWILPTIVSSLFNIKVVGDMNDVLFCPFVRLDAGWKSFVRVSVVLTVFVVLFVVYWIYYLVFLCCCKGKVWDEVEETGTEVVEGRIVTHQGQAVGVGGQSVTTTTTTKTIRTTTSTSNETDLLLEGSGEATLNLQVHDMVRASQTNASIFYGMVTELQSKINRLLETLALKESFSASATTTITTTTTTVSGGTIEHADDGVPVVERQFTREQVIGEDGEEDKTLAKEESISQLHSTLTALKSKVSTLFEMVANSEASNSLYLEQRLQTTQQITTSGGLHIDTTVKQPSFSDDDTAFVIEEPSAEGRPVLLRPESTVSNLYELLLALESKVMYLLEVTSVKQSSTQTVRTTIKTSTSTVTHEEGETTIERSISHDTEGVVIATQQDDTLLTYEHNVARLETIAHSLHSDIVHFLETIHTWRREAIAVQQSSGVLHIEGDLDGSSSQMISTTKTSTSQKYESVPTAEGGAAMTSTTTTAYLDLDNPSSSGVRVVNTTTLPLSIRLKCRAVQFTLFAYITICVFAFECVNSVRLGGSMFMYIDGSVDAFTYWQALLILFLLIWVFPYPLVLYFGSVYLREHLITPTQFLLMLLCPPTAAIFYCCNRDVEKKKFSKNDDLITKYILSDIYRPFRLAADKQPLMWEAVFVFQKLIIVCVAILVYHRVGKIVVLLVLLLVFLAIHIRVRPYHEQIVNIAEACSLVLLILVAVVNLVWSLSYMDVVHDYQAGRNFQLFWDAVVIVPLIVLLVVVVIFKIVKCLACCNQRSEEQQALKAE